MKLRLLLFILLLIAGCGKKEKADLLILNGKIWTGDPKLPWAWMVAVRGGKIIFVGDKNTYFNGEPKEMLDLDGRLMVPGFNDSHVHFASAGHLLLNINLLDVNNTESFIKNVKETTTRLPKGSWITGGDWGAYEAWAMGSAGGKNKSTFVPNRNMIDSLTKDYPVLVRRYDHKSGLANEAALAFLGIESETGILDATTLDGAWEKIPEKSFEQKLAESRRALEECRRWGVTTVQDMSPLDYIDRKSVV